MLLEIDQEFCEIISIANQTDLRVEVYIDIYI